jgi:RHH-type rel operon transcriptional repressor/antitoxin RelB
MYCIADDTIKEKGGGMLTVRLPENLEKRLNELASATKRPKSYYVREALERVLEDLEDAYLAETAYEKLLKSGKQPKSIDQVERDLGLAD